MNQRTMKSLTVYIPTVFFPVTALYTCFVLWSCISRTLSQYLWSMVKAMVPML